MVEVVKLILDDGTGSQFDRALRDKTLAEYGDLQIISKSNGTEQGQPIVMLTFHVLTPRGKQRAQCVTTLTNFLNAARILEARYKPDEPALQNASDDHSPPVIRQTYRGFTWSAQCIEKAYIMTVDGIRGDAGLAFSEDGLSVLAESTIDAYIEKIGSN